MECYNRKGNNGGVYGESVGGYGGSLGCCKGKGRNGGGLWGVHRGLWGSYGVRNGGLGQTSIEVYGGCMGCYKGGGCNGGGLWGLYGERNAGGRTGGVHKGLWGFYEVLWGGP